MKTSKIQVLPFKGWIAEVSSAVKHSLAATTLCQVFMIQLFQVFKKKRKKRSGKTSQELRNCPIKCLNCRKCLLKEGSMSCRYVRQVGHEGRSGTFGLQGSNFTTMNQGWRAAESCDILTKFEKFDQNYETQSKL